MIAVTRLSFSTLYVRTTSSIAANDQFPANKQACYQSTIGNILKTRANEDRSHEETSYTRADFLPVFKTSPFVATKVLHVLGKLENEMEITTPRDRWDCRYLCLPVYPAISIEIFKLETDRNQR